jgi:hypothetical protein
LFRELVKLPRPELCVTGESATPSDCENADEPAPITPLVFAFCETSTAIIATPIMASKTVTVPVMSSFDMLYDTPIVLSEFDKLFAPPGFTAAPKILEKAEPPALITPDVLEFLLTSTAIIATPIIAAITVNTELMRESLTVLDPHFENPDKSTAR